MTASTQAKPAPVWPIISGMIIGLAAAIIAVLNPSGKTLHNQAAVAQVNDKTISREKFLSHFQSYASDRKNALKQEDAHYVLQRIIDEELLVQRGVEVGLLDSDKRSRSAVVNAMIAMVTADAEAHKASDAELQAFYRKNSGYFRPTARMQVQQLLFATRLEAQQAYQNLKQGGSLSEWQQQGLEPALAIPNTLLPIGKLREYIGPSASQRLNQQSAGYIDAPRAIGLQTRILILLDKQLAPEPGFANIKPQLQAEYRRRQSEQALEEYLQWLGSRAEVEQAAELPMLSAGQGQVSNE